MGELDKKLQEVLESLNKTFDIEIQDQGDDEIITLKHSASSKKIFQN